MYTHERIRYIHAFLIYPQVFDFINAVLIYEREIYQMRKKDITFLHLLIAALIFILIKLLFPVVNGITPVGVSVIALFFATVYMWTFINISWVSLLAIALFGSIGCLNYSEIAMNSFGNWVTVFTIASCILNYSLMESGMMDRIVKWTITRKVAHNKPWLFLCLLFFSIYLMNYILDCTPSALVFFPMAKAFCEQIGVKKEEKLSKTIFLGIMLSILLGYSATPISHSIPIVFMGLINSDYNIGISFAEWMKFGIPLSFAMFLTMLLYFRIIVRPDVSKVLNFDRESVLKTMTPLSRKQKLISVTYLIVIFFWLCPTIFQQILPAFATWVTNAGYIFPVVIAIVFLVMFRIDGKPVMDFNAAAKSVSWPLILLTACIMMINPCISSESCGITEFLSNTFGKSIQSSNSGLLILAVSIIWVMVQTNFMSCFVSGQLVYTVMLPLVNAVPELHLNAPALGAVIAFACGVAFLSPPSSGPAAVFISTDYFTPNDALKYGILPLIMDILLCIFIGYPLAAAVL